jgi:hypothetical protein
MSLFLLQSVGCVQRPKVDVVPRILDDHLVFEIVGSDLNSVYTFRVDDEDGAEVWAIRAPNMNNKLVEYGALPEGAGERAGVGQVYPPDNKKPADIRCKIVTVIVSYQYDAYAARSGTFSKRMQVP